MFKKISLFLIILLSNFIFLQAKIFTNDVKLFEFISNENININTEKNNKLVNLYEKVSLISSNESIIESNQNILKKSC